MLPLINYTDQSYGRSLMKVSDVVDYSKKNNIPVAAITDFHSLSALPDFLSQCEDAKVHGIAGLTLNVKHNGKSVGDIVLLGKGNAGYAALRDLLNEAGHVGEMNTYNPDLGLELQDVTSGKYQSLFKHCMCLDGFSGSVGQGVIKNLKIENTTPAIREEMSKPESVLSKIKNQFGDGDYLGVKQNGIPSPFAGALLPEGSNNLEPFESPAVVESTIAYATNDEELKMAMQWFKDYAQPVLADLGDDAKQSKLVSRKYDNNCLLSGDEGYVPSDPPFIGADHLINRCRVPKIYSKTPSAELLNGGAQVPDLRTLIRHHWKEYAIKFESDEQAKDVGKRIDHELKVIEACGFEDYFLNIYKIKKLAESQGNDLMLRGSAVASVVMNVIGMTPIEIDPIEQGLLFDRFLREDRIEEPDVDIEFVNSAAISREMNNYFEPGQVAILSSDRGISKARTLLEKAKNTLINFYVLNEKQVKDIDGVFNSMASYLDNPRNKGKKFQTWDVWKDEVWSKMPANNKGRIANKLVAVADKFNNSPLSSEVSRNSVVFIPDGAGRYFNILPAGKGGVVEGAVGRINQTKYNLLSTGHIKYDILQNYAFSRASKMDNSLNLNGVSAMNLDDPTIKFAFNRNAFLGVNQLNGFVGNKLAARFKPKNFQELTALNALIRDGGSAALKEMIDNYLFAKENPDSVVLPEIMKPILGETHGTLLYEEQLMRLLTDVGGFEWEEADRFRSGLKKGKGHVIDDFEQPFISQAMEKHGIDQQTASNWYQPMRDKRGRFVFNKAHAVAYAHVSVRQCWQKCHYPAHYAAELALDTKGKFQGKDVDVSLALSDWQKIQQGRPLKHNAVDFVKSCLDILKREESIIDSTYKRNISSVKSEIDKALDNGAFDFSIPENGNKEDLKKYIDTQFNKLAQEYKPAKLGVSKVSKPSNKTKSSKPSKPAPKNNARQSRVAATMKNAESKPANRRKGYIGWFDDVMIGHLLDFFEKENVISGLDIDTSLSAGTDHFRFNVVDKAGKTKSFHIAATSTDPIRAMNHNKKYSMTSGFHQGGELDRTATDTLTLAALIANTVGLKDFPEIKMVKNKRGRGEFVSKDSKKLLLSELSRFARNAKSDLHDTLSTGLNASSFVPATPTSPVMTELKDDTYAKKQLVKLFEESRGIDAKGMQVQVDGGHFGFAEVRTDKLIGKDKKHLKMTEVIASYRKVTPGVPLHNTPLIEDNKHSPGGHQRFFIDKAKGRTTKMDLGFTTKKVKGHLCGNTTAGSDTLWLAEAALDFLSFNEMQRLMKATGTLPSVEENAVAVRSAGGATDSITRMLQVKLLGEGENQDFCLVKVTPEIEAFDDGAKESIKEWFGQNKIHWMSEDTPENIKDKKRLAAIMMDVGIDEGELKNYIVSHQYNPKYSFNQNVNFIYDDHLNREGHHFLHTSNMDTWLRGSGIDVRFDDKGNVDAVGLYVEDIKESDPFSKMDDETKKKTRDMLIKRFEYMTGAKSLGLALDNDGAGKADALRVYYLCKTIGIPTGSLMPKVIEKYTVNMNGKPKDVELKDHNDYLMLYKDLKKNGDDEGAYKVLELYAGNLKKPVLAIDAPAQENRNVRRIA